MTEELNDQESLVSHLTELRQRIVYSLIGIVIGCAASWAFSEEIFDIVRQPIMPYLATDSGGLVFTGVMDKFMAHIKVSILSGVIISCPFWLYQVWKFVAPGLYAKERKMGMAFMAFGTVLFLTGVTFVYKVVYPMAFKFLMGFAGDTDTPMITIGEYLSFFMTTTLVFGATFELPLILTLLGMAGVIDKEFLTSKRRYAIVLLAVLSALVTPPDVVSMFLMMIPLLLLYELSVILVGIFGNPQESE